MDAAIKARISPHAPPTSRDFSSAPVGNPNKDAKDSTDPTKVSFKDLLMNSNADMARVRDARQNGDDTRAARTDEEFAKMMQDKANKDNLRKPQNELDKDAFMKLFITQLQNQDPLNPDKSSEMASQLAQFHGLEQMLNVNKNLEKLQSDQATSRAVTLVDFVGKEVKLDGGKLRLEDGRITDATFALDADAPSVTLEVRDAAGVILATRDMGNMAKGDHKLEWDGTGNDGKKVGNGVYTFAIIAKDLAGNDLPVGITSKVKVTGVDLKDEGGSFYTDIGKVRIMEVASVGTAGAAATGAVTTVGKEAVKTLKGDGGDQGAGDSGASGGADNKDAGAQAAGASKKEENTSGGQPGNTDRDGKDTGTTATAAPTSPQHPQSGGQSVNSAPAARPAPMLEIPVPQSGPASASIRLPAEPAAGS